MAAVYHIVVCGGIAPDPLQQLEPVTSPAGPALKNELMLPVVLDPFAAHALYEGAQLAGKFPGSKLWLVSMAPKAKLQQLMMTLAQKAAFELVALDAPPSGFIDTHATAAALAGKVKELPGLEQDKLLLFGGWSSATRGTGTTLQLVGEILGVTDQFQGVDQLAIDDAGVMTVLERVEGGQHQVSQCQGPPAVFGWATGDLPEPPNNPKIGMQNMPKLMPAIQKALPAQLAGSDWTVSEVSVPEQRRQTRIVTDLTPAQIAAEILAWMEE